MKRLKFFLVGLLAIALLGSSALAADSTVTVTPDNMGIWQWYVERETATGAMVVQESAPMGLGSAWMEAADSTGRMLLATDAYAGTYLKDMTALSYSTYQDPASGSANHLMISLQFDIDLNDDGIWDGRLVYEPVYTVPGGTIQKGVWYDWNTLAGKWWITRTNGSFCAWDCFWPFANVLAAFPNAKVLAGTYLKAGGAGTPFIGAVDALIVGINGNSVTYDFDLGKDACKNGGWMGGPFRNQGECVSYFSSSRK